MRPTWIIPAAGAAALLPLTIVIAQPAGPQAAHAAPSGPVTMKPVMTLETARRAIDAAAALARSRGAGGSIAVVDDGGHLVCLERIDGTFPASAEVAIGKARTAAVFRKPTQDFENAVRGGRTSLTAVGPMLPLEGGVPIVIDGQVVGAVGVSGAHSSTEDVEVATAGARAVSTGG
jgi:glc operon protein GlcG